MLCLVVRCGAELSKYAIGGRTISIGSSPENDLVLPFRGVSRRHCRAVGGPGCATLEDVESKNGLRLKGRRVRVAEIRPGVEIGIGEAVLTLEDADPEDLETGLALPEDGMTSRPETEDAESTTDFILGSAEGAVTLVRELAEAEEPLRQVDRPEALARACHVLGARGAAVLALAEDCGLSIESVYGELPDEGRITSLGAIGGEWGPTGTCEVRPFDASLYALVVRGASARGERRLLLVVLSGHGGPAAWQRDLVQFLARYVLPAGTPRKRVRFRAALQTGLAFPKGMVVGCSAAITALHSQMRATIGSPLDVLLLGETGTGKELYARLVHDSGRTPGGPFVVVNCAAIPSELLESELFGVHGRIATGVDPHVGRIAQASGGTLFLDEVGELSLTLQAKLLRFLQEREIHPLGAPFARRIDVRVVSASNRDLQGAVDGGSFRPDLYYRLRGLQFHLPPLRERSEDLPVFVAAFAERAAREFDRSIRGVSRGALHLLQKHAWPGNLRELQADVQRAVLLCPIGGTLQCGHFGPVAWALNRPVRVEEATRGAGQMDAGHPTAAQAEPVTRGAASEEPLPVRGKAVALARQLEQVERAAIRSALREADGNLSKAARSLGVTRAGLRMKVRRLLSGLTDG